MSLLSKLADISRAAPMRPAAQKKHAVDNLISGLMIACPDPTLEDRERDTHRVRGQHLARQDAWDTLAKEIETADKTRQVTPAGMPASELLAYGARSDVVMAAEHALFDGAPPWDAPMMEGIEGLEEMLMEEDNDPALAVVVALAHMDLGWAWRGTGNAMQISARNREAFEAHFDRAGDILDGVEQKCGNSSFYYSAKCALNGAGLTPQERIARDFEHLIDLAPKNPSPMRALGTYLSPRWFGSYQELELEARRTAARTQKHWGAGGYAWVMFDALAGDVGACETLDHEFFLEGLRDIVTRASEQHTTNVLAAYCAHFFANVENMSHAAQQVRAETNACAEWIVRHHLTELHPMVWAHAAAGFANNLNISSARRFSAMGKQHGLRIIAQLFHREIKQGRRIIFTADGPVTEPV